MPPIGMAFPPLMILFYVLVRCKLKSLLSSTKAEYHPHTVYEEDYYFASNNERSEGDDGDFESISPMVNCWNFEDNAGAIKIAEISKICPWTKHLIIKYNHCSSFVQNGLESIHHVSTEKQIVSIFTKPLNRDSIQTHRKALLGC